MKIVVPLCFRQIQFLFITFLMHSYRNIFPLREEEIFEKSQYLCGDELGEMGA